MLEVSSLAKDARPLVDDRLARMSEPHVRPLMALVQRLRSRGLKVPNVDPNDGGIGASALFLLETPGPRSVGTGFVSMDNPDPSARNMKTSLATAEFERRQVLLWNVVPHCLSSATVNRNASAVDVRAAVPDTQAFLELLPNLKVVVFVGRSAQRAEKHLRLPAPVTALQTFHTGAQSYNHIRFRADIHATFREAARLCRLVGRQ